MEWLKAFRVIGGSDISLPYGFPFGMEGLNLNLSLSVRLSTVPSLIFREKKREECTGRMRMV